MYKKHSFVPGNVGSKLLEFLTSTLKSAFSSEDMVIRYRHMPNYEDGSLPVATGDRGH